MSLFLLLAAAITPALLLMYWFWRSDRFPEPHKMVWQTFALGFLSILPAVILSVILEIVIPATDHSTLHALRMAFFRAAIPEDFTKFMVLFFFVARSTHFDEPMDGLVYGAAASMGFAAFENTLYVLDGGLGVALLRALTAVPSHCLHGAIMGYLIALYTLDRRPRQTRLLPALLIPICLHGLYDFPLMGGRLIFLTLAVLGVEWFVVVGLLRRFRKEQGRMLAEAP